MRTTLDGLAKKSRDRRKAGTGNSGCDRNSLGFKEMALVV